MTHVDLVSPLAPTRRYHALDGLRGIAAMVVLCGHAMLTSPVYADAILGTGRPQPGSLAWWMTYTPLHLLWAGTEAVFVFFILSGFVLAGPAMKVKPAWLSYYRRRIARLYLPVWGSLIFAAALVAVTPRSVIVGASWWLNGHQQVAISAGLGDAVLLGTISALNSPLWSLKWEVLFSLLLPVYVFLGLRTKNRPLKAISLTASLFGLMATYAITQSDAVRYLPIFAIGVVIYVHIDHLQRLSGRLDGRWWGLILAIALLFLSSFWVLQAQGSTPAVIVSASRLMQVCGAAMLVVTVVCWGPISALLQRPWVRWLGSRSFSLYLIHDPIVSTIAFVLGGTASPFLTLAVSLPFCLVAAELFFRLVEQPSHTLARRLSRASATS